MAWSAHAGVTTSAIATRAAMAGDATGDAVTAAGTASESGVRIGSAGEKSGERNRRAARNEDGGDGETRRAWWVMRRRVASTRRRRRSGRGARARASGASDAGVGLLRSDEGIMEAGLEVRSPRSECRLEGSSERRDVEDRIRESGSAKGKTKMRIIKSNNNEPPLIVTRPGRRENEEIVRRKKF